MLKIENLSVSYGHIKALRQVSLSADEGQIVSIVGANGAGKTTLLRTLSCLVKAQEGNIQFYGQEILGKRPNHVVAQGIVHVPEGRRVFAGLTVLDNLKVGGYRFPSKSLQQNLDRVFQLFPILSERKNQFAGTLSGGEQQMLAIGRGMMSEPKLLLLDEPSLGLAPIIINQVFHLIQEIRDSGITILLVEQNARRALEICDKAYILENGVIKMEGSGEELLHSPEVMAAYLGEQVGAEEKA